MKRAILSMGLVLGLGACSNFSLFGNNDEPPAGASLQAPGAAGPVAAIDQSSIGYFQSEVGDTVNFLVDQHALSDMAVATLTAQARWLQANPDKSVVIEGHADEQGTREYNLGLGARRASAVYNFLVSQGVTESRLSTITYGKERPLAACSTEECWFKNRRAVTVVAGGLGS